FDPLRGRADLALRLQRDALRLKAAMVDARVDVEFGQPLVGQFGPAFAPTLDHLGAVPLRSEEHTSELQSQSNLVCRLLPEKNKNAPLRAPRPYGPVARRCASPEPPPASVSSSPPRVPSAHRSACLCPAA